MTNLSLDIHWKLICTWHGTTAQWRGKQTWN